MRIFFDRILTAIALIFFIPTVLILASWNAIPGDTLYPVKGWFEDAALAVTIRTPLASLFSIQFTERRFSEANRLLAKKGSTYGYALLVSEASQSKDIIVQKSDVKSAAELITKIEDYQEALEEKRVAVETSPEQALLVGRTPTPVSQSPAPTPYVVPKTPDPQPPVTTTAQTTRTTILAPNPSPTPAPSTQVVVADLNKTSAQLEKIKDEIKRSVPASESKAKEIREMKKGGKEERKEHKPTIKEVPQETQVPTPFPTPTTSRETPPAHTPKATTEPQSPTPT